MSDQPAVAGPRRRLPRTRGATGGVLLIVLGAWGGLAPFIGPYYNFGFTPDDAWRWTAARGWLEVLPGGVVFIGGILLVVSASRSTTVTGAVLGVIGGAWFVVGTPLAGPLRLGTPGQPLGTNQTQRAMELLALFTGLGALILIVAASAFGRLSVVTVRDADAAARRERAAEEAAAAERAAAEQSAAAREAVHRDGAVRHRGEPEDEPSPADPRTASTADASASRVDLGGARADRTDADAADAADPDRTDSAGAHSLVSQTPAVAGAGDHETEHRAYRPPDQPVEQQPVEQQPADTPLAQPTPSSEPLGSATEAQRAPDPFDPPVEQQPAEQPVWHSSTASYAPTESGMDQPLTPPAEAPAPFSTGQPVPDDSHLPDAGPVPDDTGANESASYRPGDYELGQYDPGQYQHRLYEPGSAPPPNTAAGEAEPPAPVGGPEPSAEPTDLPEPDPETRVPDPNDTVELPRHGGGSSYGVLPPGAAADRADEQPHDGH